MESVEELQQEQAESSKRSTYPNLPPMNLKNLYEKKITSIIMIQYWKCNKNYQFLLLQKKTTISTLASFHDHSQASFSNVQRKKMGLTCTSIQRILHSHGKHWSMVIKRGSTFVEPSRSPPNRIQLFFIMTCFINVGYLRQTCQNNPIPGICFYIKPDHLDIESDISFKLNFNYLSEYLIIYSVPFEKCAILHFCKRQYN